MSRWCPLCAEPVQGRMDRHEKVCPGFQHPPRRPRPETRGGMSASGYRLDSDRVSRPRASGEAAAR